MIALGAYFRIKLINLIRDIMKRAAFVGFLSIFIAIININI